MAKAAKWRFVLAAVAAGALAVVLLLQDTRSAVLLGNAVAHPVGEGAVAITLTLDNPGAPVTLVGIASPEAASAALSGGEAVPVPAGGSPSLALDGVHGVLGGVSGPLEAGRLIPVTLRFSDGEATTQARLAEAEDDPHAGHVMTVDAGGMSVALEVVPEGDGWLVRVHAPGLTFDADAADGPHVPGRGHGHLYLDGLKLQRLYAPEARIGALPAGSYEVTVSLNANDHRAYAVEGRPLVVSARIEAP